MGDLLMKWICSDKQLPTEFGVYDVTIEDCCSAVALMNVAMYRPKGEQWELLIDKHNYEGYRVIAWRNRGKPFSWEEMCE